MHSNLHKFGDIRFQGDTNALYDRHLVFDYAIDPQLASAREQYEAVARSLRDVLALRWLHTKKTIIAPIPSGSATSTLTELWLDRDLTWLEFNRRVMAEALDDRTPWNSSSSGKAREHEAVLKNVVYAQFTESLRSRLLL
jgi:hypothetical protein